MTPNRRQGRACKHIYAYVLYIITHANRGAACLPMNRSIRVVFRYIRAFGSALIACFRACNYGKTIARCIRVSRSCHDIRIKEIFKKSPFPLGRKSERKEKIKKGKQRKQGKKRQKGIRGRKNRERRGRDKGVKIANRMMENSQQNTLKSSG